MFDVSDMTRTVSFLYANISCQVLCSQSGRQPMSSQLSLLVLFCAGLSWWNQPLPLPACIPEVFPQPQAEFPCSAWCPAPSPPPGMPSHLVDSRFGPLTGFVSGVLCCLVFTLLLYQRRSERPSLVIKRKALVSDTSFAVPEETEPQLSIEGPLTPAFCRRLKQQRNCGSA